MGLLCPWYNQFPSPHSLTAFRHDLFLFPSDRSSNEGGDLSVSSSYLKGPARACSVAGTHRVSVHRNLLGRAGVKVGTDQEGHKTRHKPTVKKLSPEESPCFLGHESLTPQNPDSQAPVCEKGHGLSSEMGAEPSRKSAAHWERHATAGPGAEWVGRWLQEHALEWRSGPGTQ